MSAAEALAETLAGRIVLSIGAIAATDTDEALFGTLPREEYERVKEQLDELHLRKIDLADEVFVLSDARGYFGSSTIREIRYAIAHGKHIRWLEPAAKERWDAISAWTDEAS